MTNQEAKEKLYMEWQKFLEDNIDYAGVSEAYKMAFKALEQEPCEDAISRQEVLDLIADYDLSMGQVVRGIHALPSVTPQEPRWIPCSEKKPDKGGEYLLWGKIDESEEEDYCFIGDYHEFDEVFGTEISNYDPKTLGFIDTEIEEYYSVVAWMPLPSDYSEEEE